MGGMEVAEQDEKPVREEGHPQEPGHTGQESSHNATNQEQGAA